MGQQAYDRTICFQANDFTATQEQWGIVAGIDTSKLALTDHRLRRRT